jgi:hypothetical protein
MKALPQIYRMRLQNFSLFSGFFEGPASIEVCEPYQTGYIKRWCISNAADNVIMFLANASTPNGNLVVYDTKFNVDGLGNDTCDSPASDLATIQFSNTGYCEPYAQAFSTADCNGTHILRTICYSADCSTDCNETVVDGSLWISALSASVIRRSTL